MIAARRFPFPPRHATTPNHEPRLATALLPALQRLDPEQAHGLSLAALRLGLAGRAVPPTPNLATSALGLDFATPIGLAAGFDKNGVAALPLKRLGFGFIEIGTVTPRRQPGNARPRLFRLAEDRAIINRMGFNGTGADAMQARLRTLPATARPIGVNLGLNKNGAAPLADYALLAAHFAALADYLVINVSSPNTPGLRDLQAEDALAAILATIARPRPPLLVKLAPDLAEAALPAIIEGCIAAGVDGLILSNTTIARPTLASSHAGETGGLSGAPLFAASTRMLARAFVLARGRLTLIGVGGVTTAADVLTKLEAGASLVQLYTALIYAGPALPARLNTDLSALLAARGYASPRDAVGKAAESLAQ